MVDTMKLALEEERQARETLHSELSSTRSQLQQQQTTLAQREASLQELQQNLSRTSEQAQSLGEQRQALEERARAAQQQLERLSGELGQTRDQARRTDEERLALRREVEKQNNEAEELRKKMAELERLQNATARERAELQTKAAVAEAERRMALEQVTAMRSEVEQVRTEKEKLQANTTKLAQSVASLADQSGTLTKEIRENRPETANAIFAAYRQNRVDLDISGSRPGLIGNAVQKKKNAQTVLVMDGNQAYALCHVADTPLSFGSPNSGWQSLQGSLTRGTATQPVSQVAFSADDPRIVLVPIDATQAKPLGARFYKISNQPFRFQEAVLVGADEEYFGECRFQIDPALGNYVKMDRSLIRGMFGKFNPSRGDLVLSKTGELLGVMVNAEYCLVLSRLKPEAALPCGTALNPQNVGRFLESMGQRVARLPFKLQ
jgi:hypothetical protein